MKIHEYQAKRIFGEYGILVPISKVASTPEEAQSAAEELGTPVMVKAQILAGGRGKAGGIREAKSPAEAREIAFQLLAKPLITSQTPEAGLPVGKVLVQKKMNIREEFYLGVILDRQNECPVIIASSDGGTAIEETAQKNPEKIQRGYINPISGPDEHLKNKLARGFKVEWFLEPALADIISKLYRIFEEKDCLLAEINPLILADDNQFYALDAKMDFDDNALFRHSDIKELKDASAAEYPENYIKLTGNIGCVVNGAGLAMATMDMIKFFGGQPANFFDVGGGASPEKIKNAFEVLLSDPSLRVIFINIFGGIFRCDNLANGLAAAFKGRQRGIPIVLRMEGNSASEGLTILIKNQIKFFKVNNLKKGAEIAVKLARTGGAQ